MRTVVGAPGKALITGGYLVLERPNSGLVLTTTSRFFTVIEHDAPEAAQEEPTREAGVDFEVLVESPQFLRQDKYKFEIRPFPETLESRDAEHPNQYVYFTILHALIVIAALLPQKIRELAGHQLLITILGDNDFYSQRSELDRRGLPLCRKSLESLPKFLPPDRSSETGDVAKTGLGSSAALVSSLTAGLLSHFGLVNLPSAAQTSMDPAIFAEDLALVHNLAQYSHCRAQGKIGSGFDVSSAVFGSHRYTRFSPSVLRPLLDSYEKEAAPDASRLLDLVCPRPSRFRPEPTTPGTFWDSVVTPLQLPPNLSLMLGEVQGGSSTPLLVSRLLQWRATNPEQSNPLWISLAALNDKIADLLIHIDSLAAQNRQSYLEQLQAVVTERSSAPSDLRNTMDTIRATFYEVRRLLKEMGTLADVPVEPDMQSARADRTMEIPGVLMAGVPGAGGFDAIFAVFIDFPEVRAHIEQLWSSLSLCPLTSAISHSGLLAYTGEQWSQ